jgi:hypothetical protein
MHPGKILGSASELFVCTDKAEIISTTSGFHEYLRGRGVSLCGDFFEPRVMIVIVTAGPLA